MIDEVEQQEEFKAWDKLDIYYAFIGQYNARIALEQRCKGLSREIADLKLLIPKRTSVDGGWVEMVFNEEYNKWIVTAHITNDDGKYTKKMMRKLLDTLKAKKEILTYLPPQYPQLKLFYLKHFIVDTFVDKDGIILDNFYLIKEK